LKAKKRAKIVSQINLEIDPGITDQEFETLVSLLLSKVKTRDTDGKRSTFQVGESPSFDTGIFCQSGSRILEELIKVTKVTWFIESEVCMTNSWLIEID
jgi:hypothetical protein